MAYGISSIGTNSYNDPTMMSMMGGYGGMYGMNGMSPYGYGGMGMMGMMGMMPPQYLEQMAQTQAKMAEIQQLAERQQMNNATANHQLLLDAEVQNMSAHDRALFEKSCVDGDINQGIKSLASVIRKGDTNAICEEYDKLKQNIYAKYGDEFIENGIIGDERKVREHIERLYTYIISKQNGGEIANLRYDLQRYGENAISFGFNKALFGSSDYHDKYTEEADNYIYGERIDNKHGKDKMEKIGGAAGWTVKQAGFVGIPAVIGGIIGKVKGFGKWWGAGIGALLGLGAELWWQHS